MCLLVAGMIASGCGNVEGNGGSGGNPVISSIEPTSGDSSTLISIRGSNFGSTQGDSRLYYGSQNLNPTSWSDSVIQVRLYDSTLSSIPTGRFTVEVSGRSAAQSSQEFTSTAQSRIYGISPSSGKAGDLITISLATGTNSIGGFVTFFDLRNPTNAKQVTVTSVANTGSGVNYYCYVPVFELSDNVNDTVLGIQVGTYSMYLQTAVTFNYTRQTPTVSYVNPQRAKVGDIITIAAYNGGFGDTQSGAYVLVNGNYVTPTEWNDKLIRFAMPDIDYTSETAEINLSVRGNNISISNRIQVVPTITQITASNQGGILGLGSTYVYTITGTGFASNASVNLNISLQTPPTFNKTGAKQFTMMSSSNLKNYSVCVANGTIISDYVVIPDVP